MLGGLDGGLFAPGSTTALRWGDWTLSMRLHAAADRWLDLSIVLRNLSGESPGWEPDPRFAERFLRRYGIAEIDERKSTYYRLLDEFI